MLKKVEACGKIFQILAVTLTFSCGKFFPACRKHLMNSCCKPE